MTITFLFIYETTTVSHHGDAPCPSEAALSEVGWFIIIQIYGCHYMAQNAVRMFYYITYLYNLVSVKQTSLYFQLYYNEAHM